MIKFKWLTGDVNYLEYGGTWVSQKFNNGDFDYYLVKILNNMEDYRDYNAKYCVTLGVVSPEASSKSNELNDAIRTYCFDSDLEITEEHKIEALVSYGSYVTIKEFSGNNYQELFKQCSEEAKLAVSLFGFFMDRYQNRLGATGWDYLQGIRIPQLERR